MSSKQAHALKGGVSVKAMIAVFAAGVLAGVIAVLPLILPEQEPSPAKQTIAAASTDARTAASTDARAPSEPAPPAEAAADPCAGQTWPYIDGACADAKAKEQDTRQVRVISTDRAAPTTLATRTPRIEPTRAPRIEPKPVKPEPPRSEQAPAAAGEPTAAEPGTAITAQVAPPQPAQVAVAPQPEPAQPTETSNASEPKPAAPAVPDSKPVVAEVKRVPLEPKPAVADAKPAPVTETKPAAVADAKPATPEPKPTASAQQAGVPAVEPVPAAEHVRRKTKAVTVSTSKPAKRSRPQRAPEQPSAAPASLEPVRELARGRTQPVADPGHSLAGPTVVRTYNYADGRRVTVYQPADRAGSSQALAYGGDQRGSRRMLVPVED